MVKQVVVASVPFFANKAQSALSTSFINFSAKSTTKADGPFPKSNFFRCSLTASSTSALL